jgi:hypothetical protein
MNYAIKRMGERKQQIVTAKPERHSVVRRAAEDLSRRTVDLVPIELLTEALHGITTLCYERDELGHLVNVDGRTGKLLVPAPWGRLGHTKWGVTPSEANVLRAILFARQGDAALFNYHRGTRSWMVNRAAYRTLDQALEHWRLWPITVAELRQARAHLVARQVGA